MLNTFSPILDVPYYPTLDRHLSFEHYIQIMRNIVKDRRKDLQQSNDKNTTILNANTPYECYPPNPIKQQGKIKYGALLMHGLLDCPFSLHDLSSHLSAQGILSRAMLLPGHGTHPTDLLSVTYQEWIKAVRYGIETLRNEVEYLFLIGYSTGAALSIYHAMQEIPIDGIILLSPAIRIKAPIDAVHFVQQLRRIFNKKQANWLWHDNEIDYAKYQSIPFNAVFQVAALTDVILNLQAVKGLKTPMLMIVSKEDETISSRSAINFFMRTKEKNNQLIVYGKHSKTYRDKRIIKRETIDLSASIKHFSHIAIPFAPTNTHYGKNGDFIYASTIDRKSYAYGAYNVLDQHYWDLLHRLGISKNKRLALTYNPDFDFMANHISQFILRH